MSDDVLIVLLLNIIVHIVFVCGSSEHQKSACPHYDKKKLVKVAQARHATTV